MMSNVTNSSMIAMNSSAGAGLSGNDSSMIAMNSSVGTGLSGAEIAGIFVSLGVIVGVLAAVIVVGVCALMRRPVGATLSRSANKQLYSGVLTREKEIADSETREDNHDQETENVIYSSENVDHVVQEELFELTFFGDGEDKVPTRLSSSNASQGVTSAVSVDSHS